ncbi:MAG: hypothetical protein ACYC9L_16685 [Sulfuricaulis sp.]
MPAIRKIVVHSLSGYRPEFDALVQSWIREGINYVGIAGIDASKLEDIVDEICVGNGVEPYFMLTASHAGEPLSAAVALADQLTGEYAGPVRVIEF